MKPSLLCQLWFALALAVARVPIRSGQATSERINESAYLQASPTTEILEPRYFKDLGAVRTNVRHGPLHVPSSSEGMGKKLFVTLLKPCQDCYITSVSVELEFPDGSAANANNSMWLHHATIMNMARRDIICTSRKDQDNYERVWGAGNERTFLDLTLGGTRKLGYYVGANDTLIFAYQLMNEIPEARDAVMALEWEHVPAAAAGFRSVQPVWLDVDGFCGSYDKPPAEVAVPPGGDAAPFTLSMAPGWTASFAGEVIAATPHLHDGGLTVETSVNGRIVCAAEARYGESAGFVSPSPPGGMSDMDMPPMRHISSLPWSQCTGGLGTVEEGDVLSVTARYDLTTHPGMMEHGHHGDKPAGVMGIAVLYVLPWSNKRE